MEFLTEAYQRDLHECFDVFKAALGGEPWRKVVGSVNNEIKGNPFLADYLRRKFSIPFALQRVSEGLADSGRKQMRVDESVSVYEACVLIMQFCHLWRVLDRKQSIGLAQRIKGALRNAPDMRAMIFELQLLTHFAHRGYAIALPTTCSEVSADGFATRDGVTYEIECKSISGDKGRQVHRREALEIHHLFQKSVLPVLASLQDGLLVRVIFQARPPKRHDDRLKLMADVKAAILDGKRRYATPAIEVETVPFSMLESPFSGESRPTEVAVTEFLKNFGVFNREAISFCRPRCQVIVLSLESSTPDRLLEETFAVASDAARRQISGNNPALLCFKFEDLNAEQMVLVGAEDGEPTALRRHAHHFLGSRSATNVSLIGFFADGPLLKTPEGTVTRRGVNYYFVNEKNRFSASIPATGLFNS